MFWSMLYYNMIQPLSIKVNEEYENVQCRLLNKQRNHSELLKNRNMQLLQVTILFMCKIPCSLCWKLKYMLFKPLFNNTSQMDNIYSLHTFTVFHLCVLVLHSLSSGRTYMSFTWNHTLLCTRMHITENFKTCCSVYKIQ